MVKQIPYILICKWELSHGKAKTYKWYNGTGDSEAGGWLGHEEKNYILGAMYTISVRNALKYQTLPLKYSSMSPKTTCTPK